MPRMFLFMRPDAGTGQRFAVATHRFSVCGAVFLSVATPGMPAAGGMEIALPGRSAGRQERRVAGAPGMAGAGRTVTCGKPAEGALLLQEHSAFEARPAATRHCGETRGFHCNLCHLVAAAAFASAGQFQSEPALWGRGRIRGDWRVRGAVRRRVVRRA